MHNHLVKNANPINNTGQDKIKASLKNIWSVLFKKYQDHVTKKNWRLLENTKKKQLIAM